MEDQIMKTTKRSSSKTLPSPIKVSIYLLVVAVCCFINWTVLRAGDPVNSVSNSLEERLAAALVPETDPEPALEDWMLTFADEYLAVNAESEIALEEWMLSFADAYIADNAESEIALEDWMLTFAHDYVADNAESEIALENWMVDRLEFIGAEEIETEPAVEEWMVNTSSWIEFLYMARK
jgi:hypothetical protein